VAGVALRRATAFGGDQEDHPHRLPPPLAASNRLHRTGKSTKAVVIHDSQKILFETERSFLPEAEIEIER
jgi:hypothetical protein